jgi:hypothetical protein
VFKLRFLNNLKKKEKTMGFTFKKEPKETGLAAVGNPNSNTQIKLNKKQVGYIAGPSWLSKDNLWHVKFAVSEGKSFKWVTLKASFETEPEARVYLTTNFERITKTFSLHSFEDD